MPQRVHGSVFADQVLTGSLSHYLLIGADFSNSIGDQSPEYGSAAEEVVRVITEKSTIAIFSPYEIGINFALERNQTNWTAETLQESIRLLGTDVGNEGLDLSNIRVTEVEYKFLGSDYVFVVPDPTINSLMVNNTYYASSDTTLTLPDYNNTSLVDVGSLIRIFKYEDSVVTIETQSGQTIKDLTTELVSTSSYEYDFNEEIVIVFDGIKWAVYRDDKENISDIIGLQDELDSKQNLNEKGQPNGYASLNSIGQVPSNQLPSYVDDVLEFSSLSDLPSPGETGKIYVDLSTEKTYRWSGSSYIEISSTPDSTDDVPEGSTNFYFTDERVDDRVNDILLTTSDITKNYDDVNNTLTLGTSGSSNDVSSLIVKRSAERTFGITGIDFTNQSTVQPQSRRLVWNDTAGTLDLGLKGGEVTIQLGQEIVAYVNNQSGETLNDGDIVFITGAQGNRIVVEKALANTVFVNNAVLGMVTESISDNTSGYVTTQGLVRDLDTSAFSEGTDLWLSDTIPGQVTNTKPTTPSKSVYIGVVSRSSTTNGSVFVKPGYNLSTNELSDIDTNSIQSGDALLWNGLFFEPEYVHSPETYMYVRSTNDLPAPVGDEYILPENTTVILDGNIDLGSNAIRIPTGTLLRGFGRDTITTTNTNGAVRASNIGSQLVMKEFSIISPNGPCLDLTGSINYQLNLFYVGLIGASAGTITGFDVQTFKSCFINCANGLIVDGTVNKLYVDGSPFYGITSGNAAITLASTLSINVIDLTTLYFKFDDGVGIRAEIGYNLALEGIVRGVLSEGNLTPLEGLSPSEPKWRMKNNTGIRDSRVAAVSILNTNTIIDIVNQNEFVPLIGPFNTLDVSERFEVLPNNVLSYTGLEPALVTMVTSITAEPAPGDTVEIRLVKNGIPVPGGLITLINGQGSGSDIRSGTVTTITEIVNGDTIYGEIENTTSNQDVTVYFVSLSITG